MSHARPARATTLALFLASASTLAALPLIATSPVDAAMDEPCSMRVSLNRITHERYANGVERTEYKVRVTDNGHTQSAEVQRMVLPKSAEPRLITKKLGTTGQLRSQLDSKKGAKGIAAVNGDFFYGYGIEGSTVLLPRNASVTKGKAVRLHETRTRVVGIDKEGSPFAGEIGVSGSVVRGKTTYPVSSVNWQSVAAHEVAVYTRSWADMKVAPRPAGSVEWVVRGDKIRKVWRGNKTGKSVPPKSRVIAFGSDHKAMAKTARIGRTVSISVRQNSSTGVAVQEAIGRGLALVRDGVAAFPCSVLQKQQRPRTTVGWLADGRWATLTVPGSGYDANGYRVGGLGLAQESSVAIALGFVNAVELDGGGSTTAYVRRADNDWDRVDDKDSIYQRPVPNALLFIKPRR